MYGYQSDDKQSSSMSFGLNQKVNLIKLEYNPNGGKDNTPLECLDVSFEFPGGGIRSWRQFPVTQAIDKDGNKVTDKNSPEMKAAFNEFNQKLTQLMKCFVTEQDLRTALSTVHNFKSFCDALTDLLPKDFSYKPIDVFCQYQWQPKSGTDKKYIEIPSNVKQGKVFTETVEGNFNPIVIKDGVATYQGTTYTCQVNGKKSSVEINGKTLEFNSSTGLMYLSENDSTFVIHPVTRTEWFVKSNFYKDSNEEVIQSSWD